MLDISLRTSITFLNGSFFSFTVCDGHPRPEPEPAGILPLRLLQDRMQPVGPESLIYSVCISWVFSLEQASSWPLLSVAVWQRCMFIACGEGASCVSLLRLKGTNNFFFVYTFIVIISLGSNKRINEPCQGCTFTLSFRKFWCVSTAASVTVVLFSRGPCTHGNQICVSKIYPCIRRARHKLYMSVCCLMLCIFAVKRDLNIV